jgi:Fe2+ transport system protein FeoA
MPMTLDQLQKQQIARVCGFSASLDGHDGLVARLREVGFAEGDEVEFLYHGPVGRTPLCFRLNRTLIALRAPEAQVVQVVLEGQTPGAQETETTP